MEIQADIDAAMSTHDLAVLRILANEMQDLDTIDATAVASHTLGYVYTNTADYPQALEHYQKALQLYEQRGNRSSAALVRGNLGNVYTSTGNYGQALELLQQALLVFTEMSDRVSAARITSNIGNVYRYTGDLRLALEHYQQALRELEEHGSSISATRVTGNIIGVLIGLNRVEEAAELLQKLSVMAQDDIVAQGMYYSNSALLAEHLGDLDSAWDNLHAALTVVNEAGMRYYEAAYHRELRELAQKRNDFEAYIEHNNAYQRLQMAVVLFMDLVSFTTMSSSMDPNDVVKMLSSIFASCDAIMATHGLMKIKTIGDSYMAVAFPVESSNSEQRTASIVERAASAALDMLDALSPSSSRASSPIGSPIQVRIGLHVGPVTAGIIGTERLQYDVWGDTVNVASRMESTGEAGRIHVSEQFALLLSPSPSHLRERGDNSPFPIPCSLFPRGEIEIKGKGPMTTYWLERA